MPTIDPKDLPSYTKSGSYEVSNFQTSLQRSFERWLESPSPTSERLVDQSLVSAGREPLFSASSQGRATGQPSSFPRPYTGAMRRPTLRDARGKFTSLASQNYSGPGYAAPQFSGFSYGQQATSYAGAGAYIERNQTSTRELTRLFKNIDKNLASIDQIDNQILTLGKTSAGSSRGPTRMIPSWIPGAPARAYQPLLGGAIPAGLGIPPRPPGNVTFSNPGGPGFQVTPPPGGGGAGGGGAGGGGAGGGGAGGGGGVTAFAGGLFGSALGRNGWAAAAGEAAALGARWPLHLGHALQGLLRSSSPYTDWQTRLADMTALPASRERSGSARRVGLERDLLPYAGGAVPEWMSKLGLTPSSAAEVLDRMGGGVQTGTEPLQMIQNFRELRLGAGFRMAPEGSSEVLGMMGQKYGITQPGGQAAFPGTFAQYMAQGQSGGADVKDLLKSISESTEALVKTGIKLDLSQTTGWADFLQRMLTVNLPSAQAGQMGGQIVSGMQGAGQHPFANPVTGTVFAQLISQTDWNEPEQVKRLLGKTPEEIQNKGADWEKTGLAMLQQGKTSPLAMLYGSRMISGSPEGLARIGDIVGQMGGGGAQGDAIRQMLMGSFLGQDYVTGSGALAGIKAQKPADIPGAATPLEGTLPSEVFRSQTEAFTAAFRGMRADFEEFGSKIHWVNNLLDGIIDRLGRLLGREVIPGGVPGIPLGGQKIPGGYEAPVPGFGGAPGGAGGGRTGAGSAPPSFGAAGEYGAGQGTTPSGGSNVPSGAGRQYGAASSWEGGPRYSASTVAPNDALNNWGSIGRTGNQPGQGRWRSFATPEEGVRALRSQLERYAAGGVVTAMNPSGAPLNTLSGIISTWAPPGENNTEQLIQRAEKWMGVGRHDKLDLSNPETMRKLTTTMIANEHGGVLPQGAPQAMIDKALGFGGAGASTADVGGKWRTSDEIARGVKPGQGAGGGIISGAQAAPMPGFGAGAVVDRTRDFGVGNSWGQMHPEGMIIHNTGMRGSTEDVMNALNQRGLGTQFIIDREGKISQILPEGAKGRHIMEGWGPKGEGRSNANMQGVEIIARNDSDVNQAQVGSALSLIKRQSAKYGYDPTANVFGHGEVNPGHKDAREGMTVVDAVRSGALAEPERSPVQVDRAPAPSNSGVGKDEYGGGGHQSFNWDDVHDAVGFLGRMARETGEHLSDLGHGARSAGRGMSNSSGPNPSTSPRPNPAAAATP